MPNNLSLANNTVTIDDVGHVVGKKCGVFAYLNTPSSTTITLGNTFQYIEGSFTNDVIEEFSLINTPAIRYDGVPTQYFEIEWHATFSSNHAGCAVKVGIKKGTNLINGSIVGTYAKTANELYSFSGTCVTSLATNDTIQLVVTSDSTNDIITFEYFTTTLKEFFD